MTENVEKFANRYKILKTLGQGGMGKVYLAYDPNLLKEVAIKVVLSYTDEEAVKIQREARAIAKLKTPYVAEIRDFGATSTGEPYIVMEYIEGKDLAEYLRIHGPMFVDEALSLFLKISEGLIHAHKESVLHRDIKPSNIVLDQTSEGVRPVIIDFGLAKVMKEDLRASSTKPAIGSPPYMSPEQIKGEPLDERSDIYSLGCVMFETLTGTPPFLKESAIGTIDAHLNAPMPSLAEAMPIAPPAVLEEIIAKCLAKNPSDRWRSALELQAALIEVSGNENSHHELSATIAKYTPERKGQQTYRLVAIACFALLIVGVLYFILVNRQTGNEMATIPDPWSRNYVDKTFNVVDETISPEVIEQSSIRIKYKERDGTIKSHYVSMADLGTIRNFEPHWIQIRSQEFDDADIEYLSGIISLKDMFLINCPKVKGPGLRFLANSNLCKLNIADLTVSGELISNLHVLRKLQFLEIDQWKLSPDVDLTPLKSTTISSVQFKHCTISDDVLKVLSEMPKLAAIDLESTTGFTSSGIRGLNQNRTLSSFTIRGLLVDSRIMSAVADLERITYLCLSAPVDLSYLKKTESLISLNLIGPQAVIAPFARLEEDDNQRSSGSTTESQNTRTEESAAEQNQTEREQRSDALTRTDMLEISKIPNLSALQLGAFRRLDDDAIEVIPSMKLISLTLPTQAISDSGLRTLAEAKTLRNLYLKYGTGRRLPPELITLQKQKKLNIVCN